MHAHKRYWIGLIFGLWAMMAVAQPGEDIPLSWDYAIEQAEDGTPELVFEANLDDNWTIYSQEEAEDGPLPTSIEYDLKEGVELLGAASETGHRKQAFDPIFEVDVIKYLSDEPFVLRQKVKPVDPTQPIKGYINYMVCDDSKCKALVSEFYFDLSKNYADFEPPADANPVVFITGDTIDQSIASLQETYEEPLTDCGGGEETISSNFWWSFIIGFLNGLLAILTPCVFPMIPITVGFFTKDTKRKGWVNGLLYGVSIILLYVGLGLLITALFGPEALNRLSTNWIANTIFFLIFVAFALSFFGFFEITLPSSWSTRSDQLADKGGLIGIFFMAATLALVSFSCTGPLIGQAIVLAAKSTWGPLPVMLGFAVALAVPFGLFAAFPAWLNSLPRSGGWMNSVKVVIGFLELALALKFLSVADMTNHWNFLKYELFMGLWVLIFGGMALYLFGFIKFPHDSPIKKLSTTRWVFALLATALTIYLATGFRYDKEIQSYKALSLMSGLAPPTTYNFFLEKPEVDPEIKAKYPSYTKCANNIDCFKDYYDGVAYAKEVGKPVFLDHTGYGCVNCRKVEEHIWIDPEIRRKLNEDFVLISLYTDDDKKLEETLFSKTRNKPLRDVGNKWADFQILNFKQNSQPLYVMLTTDEEVIAAPRGYVSDEGIEEYAEYLDCGLTYFRSLSERQSN